MKHNCVSLSIQSMASFRFAVFGLTISSARTDTSWHSNSSIFAPCFNLFLNVGTSSMRSREVGKSHMSLQNRWELGRNRMPWLVHVQNSWAKSTPSPDADNIFEISNSIAACQFRFVGFCSCCYATLRCWKTMHDFLYELLALDSGSRPPFY